MENFQLKSIIFLLFILCPKLGQTILLSDHAILKLNREHVAPFINDPNNIKKYKNLPLCYNQPEWRWEGKDFPRVIALLEFRELVKKYSIAPLSALYFNIDDDPEIHLLNPQEITNVYYDGSLNTDLHFFEYPKKDFDFVMINQTLEHIYDPITCLKRLKNHMRKGGLLYFNVPACNIPHAEPRHYYTGFTSMGIAAIVASAGFKILEIGQWGSLEYINYIFEKGTWPDYRELTNYENNMKCPVIIWCLAVAL
jgi:SAM-dependent methyltransferase